MPEVAMVSTILLCEITKITTGTLIMTMVAAAAVPERAMPPATIWVRA